LSLYRIVVKVAKNTSAQKFHSISIAMDDFGFSATLKRREAELVERKKAMRKHAQESSLRVENARNQTAYLLAERDLIKQEAEQRAQLESIRDRGAPDGGVSFEMSLNLIQSAPCSVHETDRISLPTSVLSELSSNHSVVYPLMFEVYSEITKKRTHCGVLDFDAPDGCVILTKKVVRCLGLEDINFDHSIVRIRYKHLEKCKHLRCKIPSQFLSLYPDIRSFLEANLRTNFVTISEGDSLMINSLVPVIIEKLEPDFACCLIDTDVDLELTLIDLSSPGSPPVWNLGTPYQFDKIESIPLYLPSDLTDTDTVKISITNGDLFISLPPLIDASFDCFDFLSTIQEDKDGKVWNEVRISLDDIRSKRTSFNSWPEIIFVGCSELPCLVQTELIRGKLTPSSSAPSTMCMNCHQSIPTSSIDLHIIHCMKRFKPCPDCKTPIADGASRHDHCEICWKPYKDWESHLNQWHSKIRCSCGSEVERYELDIHKLNECPNRLVLCRFCSQYFPVGDVTEMDARDRLMGFKSIHEGACGNRTDKCQVCGRFERLKDMDLHQKAFHNN